jgi:hypothetical protein
MNDYIAMATILLVVAGAFIGALVEALKEDRQ